MAKKLKGDQVFTGQLLKEGDVVYLTDDGIWSVDFQTAAVASNEEAVEALENIALDGIAANLVIDVYAFVVTRNDAGKLVASEIRERMRTQGPSMAYGLDA